MQELEKEQKTSMADEYVQLGQTLLGNEKPEDALEFFDKALLEDGMHYDAYVSRGIALIMLRRTDEARESLERAIKIQKDSPDAWFHLGNLDLLEGKPENGIEHYNKAVAFGLSGDTVYFNLGLLYEMKEDMDEAVRNYNKAIQLDGNNPTYRSKKAALQIRVGKYAEAIRTCEELRQVAPDSFESFHLAAAAYTMMGNYDAADALLAFAEEAFPSDREILFDRIRVLLTKGDVDAAIARLDKMEAVAETVAEKKEILVSRAKAAGQKEDIEGMIAALEKALSLGEDEQQDVEARYLLMNAYLATKRYEKLYATANEIGKGDDTNAYVLSAKYYAALSAKAMGKANYIEIYKDAIRYYRAMSMNDPNRVDAYLFRAVCLKDMEQYDKALELVDFVLKLQPESGQLHAVRANILKAASREDEAQKAFTQAERYGCKEVQLLRGL